MPTSLTPSPGTLYSEPKQHMDGLGLCMFDAVSFEHTLGQFILHQPDQNHQPYSSAQINSPHYMTSPHQIHSLSHEEPDHFLDNPAAAYYKYPHFLMDTHSLPGTPIPPTPHSCTFPFAPHLRNGLRKWCEAHFPTLQPCPSHQGIDSPGYVAGYAWMSWSWGLYSHLCVFLIPYLALPDLSHESVAIISSSDSQLLMPLSGHCQLLIHALFCWRKFASIQHFTCSPNPHSPIMYSI